MSEEVRPATPVVDQGVGKGWPFVAGRCPACGWSSLFLGAGGHVTCSRLDCSAPCAADDLLHPEPPAPIDWLAQFKRAAEVAEAAHHGIYAPVYLRMVAESLQELPADVVEAIGQALLGRGPQ